MNKKLSDLDSLLAKLVADVYTSNSELRIVQDVNKLIKEKNRIVLSNPVFFNSILRAFALSVSIKLDRIVQKGPRYANIHEIAALCKHLEGTIENVGKKVIVKEMIDSISRINEHRIIRDNKKLRDMLYAHLGKDLSNLGGVRIDLTDYSTVFQTIGDILNSISSAFFDKGTILSIVGDDRTYTQFKRLDRASSVLSYLELHEDSSHPALQYHDILTEKYGLK